MQERTNAKLRIIHYLHETLYIFENNIQFLNEHISGTLI